MPWSVVEVVEDLVGDLGRCRLELVGVGPGGDERVEIVAEERVLELAFEVVSGPGGGESFGPVGRERGQNVRRGEVELVEREAQVEQVAALGSLVEGADLGGDEFDWLEGLYLGLSGPPVRVDVVGLVDQGQGGGSFVGVDLDLDP